MRTARAALEGAAWGIVLGLVFGCWDIRLHADLAHGTPWLAADRVRAFLPPAAGGGAAIVLTIGLALATARRGRAAPLRVLAGLGTLAAAWGACSAVDLLRWHAWMRVLWRHDALSAGALATIAVIAISAALALTLGRRRAPRARVAASLAIVALAAGVVSALPLAMGRRAAGRPSLVLVSLDTLRADRLGIMGYARPTSPLLDRLAAEGAVFERAFSAAPWTLPSHASLFTSLLPYDHGVLRVENRVRPRLLLLAERLRDAGYRTAAFTGGGYVSWGYGFDQGFEVFVDHSEGAEGGPERIADGAIGWARARRGTPFFLLVHTYEIHGPYTNADFADPADRGRLPTGRSEPAEGVLRDPTAAERRYIADLYDGDVRRADRVIGGLLESMAREGLLDGAIVVVTSDHGEDLWDHDAGDTPAHGHSLYEEILHVPLLVRAPGRVPAGCRIRTPVSLLDLAPTLLDLSGLPPEPSFAGHSLAEAVLACAEPQPSAVLAEGIRYGDERFSRREADLKAIVTPTPPGVELYDLALDPAERDNRAAAPGDRERALVDAVLHRITEAGTRRGVPDGGRPLPPELDEQLRSLGYVQ